MFYLPKMQWVCAVPLLSKPLCVCVCVFGGGRSEVLELLFQHVLTPLTPQMLPYPLFASVSLSWTFFAPAAALPGLFPLPSDSLSAVAHSSPLPCFLPT